MVGVYSPFTVAHSLKLELRPSVEHKRAVVVVITAAIITILLSLACCCSTSTGRIR